ncbi:hypothetical protein RclHR1_09520005 [Rhizophagus clarus]|uniref:Uncharacterized protein n=1 Tax=Rhizophagus clarus TaxID=94130 RepID=A0A2Z6SHU9_9GLOM|nr:hypothetical protein RclHR1_09520005 [Rhizophagus clarus]
MQVSISDTPSNYSILYTEWSQNFTKIDLMEIEPKTQNIRDVFEEELGIIVDGLVNLYGKDPNKGLEDDVKKQHIFDYITDCKISLQEIYYWLLNNQNDSNSIIGY